MNDTSGQPKISVVGSRTQEPCRYLVAGGTLAPDWAKSLRSGRTAWCEISVYRDGRIGSYGGEVWPTAWPTLFRALPASAQFGSGGIELTPAGLDALAAAV